MSDLWAAPGNISNNEPAPNEPALFDKPVDSWFDGEMFASYTVGQILLTVLALAFVFGASFGWSLHRFYVWLRPFVQRMIQRRAARRRIARRLAVRARLADQLNQRIKGHSQAINANLQRTNQQDQGREPYVSTYDLNDPTPFIPPFDPEERSDILRGRNGERLYPLGH